MDFVKKYIYAFLLIPALVLPIGTVTHHGLHLQTKEALELAEVYYGSHIYVTSGYRDKEYNKKVGGAVNSQHLYGLAIDIPLPTSPLQTKRLIWALMLGGFTSIGVYQGHIHADLRKDPAFWRG